MATNLKGPGIYLAQFAGDNAPFDSWDAITRWAGQHGFKGVQIPSWDGRLFDLQRAAESRTYCDEVKGIAKANGVEVTELGHPSAGPACRGAPGLRRRFRRIRPGRGARQPVRAPALGRAADAALGAGRPQPRADEQCELPRRARLAVPLPVAAAAAGPDRAAFDELAKRWRPIFDAFDDAGCSVASSCIPGEDLFDGATFEMFLERVDTTRAAASTTTRRTSCCSSSTTSSSSTSTTSASRPSTSRTPSSGPTGRRACTPATSRGCSRAGRFRSLGDGQVDFGAIFSKMAQYGYDRLGRARVGVLPEAPGGGRGRGREFIKRH
jgi:sugar phosphate isomerase/epimerase